MWKSRRKSSREIDTIDRSICRSPSNLTFVRSSLKDIENLIADDSINTFNKTLDQPAPCSTATATTGAGRRLSIFHRVHLANKFTRAFTTKQSPNSHNESPKLLKSPPNPTNSTTPNKFNKPNRLISLPGSENRIILYTTSLHVIRSTFEACRTVQSILRAFRVPIDERDLSMDSKFLHELHHILAESGEDENDENDEIGRTTLNLKLPRVFIGGKYIGGAEEVKRLNETGELKKVVERLPPVTVAAGGVCVVCGGFRFVVCDECRGSRKCYYGGKGGFRSCTLCNENGLVRCTFCSGG